MSSQVTARSSTVVASSVRLPVLVGLVLGAVQFAAPAAIWWLDGVTLQALLVGVIASVYIGFAVADGRPRVLAVEVAIASLFVLLATASLVSAAWLLVIAYFLHGLKDLWQERHQFVSNTRWWPPFCAAVDWVVAAGLALSLVTRIGPYA
jgi:hypothetical protein